MCPFVPTIEEINTLLWREIFRVIGDGVVHVNFIICEITNMIGYTTLYKIGGEVHIMQFSGYILREYPPTVMRGWQLWHLTWDLM